jgi:hypothetical protein
MNFKEYFYNFKIETIKESHIFKGFYEQVDDALTNPLVQNKIKINGQTLSDINFVPREFRKGGTVFLYAKHPEILNDDKDKILLLHAEEKGIHGIRRWLNRLERSYRDYTEKQKQSNWKSVSTLPNFRGMKNPTNF